jgi:hypothetical protein
MNADKKNFLQKRFIPLLQKIPSDRPPAWGKMTLQQMVEHFSESVRIASGRTEIREILSAEESLPRMREFMLSDKPFRENTPNPLLPEVPAPVKNISVTKAIRDLEEELEYFFAYFSKNPNITTRNPFFGDLNFEQNVHLLHKHALHHLKQFGELAVD